MPRVRPSARRRAAEPPVAAAEARVFRQRLARWFRRNGRDLPWRRTRDPYAIVVSEAMLQQTQVSRVLEFYPRFLARFPTLERLAGAPPRAVRESWEGLGYYARARNLHALARELTTGGGATGQSRTHTTDGARRPAHHGRATLPAEPERLRRLPGIGPYTAGAVASFAFERRAALVDTNVARVLSRVFAPHLDPKRPRHLRRLWAIAEALLPRTGAAAWTHNQALIELGALVCTARVRRCGVCPVRTLCRSRAATS